MLPLSPVEGTKDQNHHFEAQLVVIYTIIYIHKTSIRNSSIPTKDKDQMTHKTVLVLVHNLKQFEKKIKY